MNAYDFLQLPWLRTNNKQNVYLNLNEIYKLLAYAMQFNFISCFVSSYERDSFLLLGVYCDGY